MQDNAERLWLQDTLNQLAIKQAAEATEKLGRALPCRVTAVNGSIVTVAFEVDSTPWTLPPVTIPKAEGPWIRSPTQVGDFGMTVPSDVYLGGISGLGGGTATMTRRGNLTALVWVPVAATSFAAVDTTKAFVSGPTGVVMQTENGDCALTLTSAGLALTINGVTVSNWTASGMSIDGTVQSTGDQIANYGGSNISQVNHVHGGVTSGGSNTGVPTG